MKIRYRINRWQGSQTRCSSPAPLQKGWENRKAVFLALKVHGMWALQSILVVPFSKILGLCEVGKYVKKMYFCGSTKKASKRIKTENSRCIKFDKLGFFDNLGCLRSRFKNILNFPGVDHTRMTQGILIKTGMGYREPGMHPRGLLTNPWAQAWDRSN